MRTITRPGKFEGEPAIAPLLYDLVLAGADEETGDQETVGWYAWLLKGFNHPAFSDFSPASMDKHDLTYDDVTETVKFAGAIIREDSDGFVRCTLFATEKSLAKEWEHLNGVYDKASEQIT